jgi:hypothetical protein
MMATVQLSMADWKRSTSSFSAWKEKNIDFYPVLRIRIRIRIFLGLLDPGPFVRGMDPDPDPNPDPSIIMQK